MSADDETRHGSRRSDVAATSSSLLDEVRSLAEARGLDIGAAKKTTDTFGYLDVELPAKHSYLAMNRATDGSIDVAVKRHGVFKAWGRTSELLEAAETLHSWHSGAEIDQLASQFAYVQASDDFGDNASAAWRWLLDYGFDDIQPLVRAVHAEPVLRARLPRVSGHGTLQLADAPTAAQANTLGFFPKVEGGWQVVAYGGGRVGEAVDVHTVAKLAADIARTDRAG